MNKKKYCVIQGNFTKSGAGDYWDEGEFNTLEEAQERMNEIYDDMNGISKLPNGFLETLIELEIFEGDSIVDYHVVDGLRYYY